MINTTRISVTLMLCATAAGTAYGEDFVYQGSLSDNGQPADGVYDLTFDYYTVIAGGAVQQTAVREDVAVADGVFQVTLPMPPSDDARFLELGVRDGASVGAYTQLSPRTFIASSPYATKAFNVEWELNAADYLAFGDGNDVVLINRDNRIGAEYFGVGADTDSFGGMYVATTDVSGLPFYGYNAGAAFESYAYHYLRGSTGELIFNVGGLNRFTMTPGGDFEVEGTTRSDEFEYNSPQVHYLSVSGNTFTSGTNRPYNAFNAVGSGLYPTVAGGSPWFLAPVSLPDGATVAQLTGYLYDNLVGPSVSLQLIRYELAAAAGGALSMASVSTSGLANSSAMRVLSDTSIEGETIDNSQYSYFLFAQFVSPTGSGSDVRLGNARITYTVTQPD